MNAKRCLTTTFFGVVAGLVTWFMTKNSPGTTTAITAAVILDRVILGFVLGISSWRVNYLLHGVVIGAIVSLPQAFFSTNFWFFWVSGVAFGFLIELFSKFIVKEPRTATA